MRFLLDTHIFLWYITNDAKLQNKYRDEIRDSSNEIFLSVASTWEILVKHQIGKLPLPQPPEYYIPEQRRLHEIASLNIDEASVLNLSLLPPIHRDPFDRMLICQAMHYGLTIMTDDQFIRSYPISIF